MGRLYACIIARDGNGDAEIMTAIADRFSHAVELIDGGVLFDVSGLERLIGTPEQVAASISSEASRQGITAGIAVAETPDAAILLARRSDGMVSTAKQPDAFAQLPLADLGIANDTLAVFSEMGIRRVEDLLAMPTDEISARYGREFEKILDRAKQKGRRVLTPNISETDVSWGFAPDMPIEDFEQLIFVVNHAMEGLFAHVDRLAMSTEQIDVRFGLDGGTSRDYEIKTSFPTLDRTFWLKLINLRIGLDPPPAAIRSVTVTVNFTRPRPVQRGLYSAVRPEPESLLLTVNKLKKLVGANEVGVPRLLDDRKARPFRLDPDAVPAGSDDASSPMPRGEKIAFSYYRPPITAEVLVRDRRIVFVRTRRFAGHVLRSSGVWRGSSHWWDRSWRTQEWDIEVEDAGIYRLSKEGNEWFVIGEYD